MPKSMTHLVQAVAVSATAFFVGCGNSSLPAGGGSGPPPPAGTEKLTVVVLVVDSLMPDEIGPSTPNLDALKAAGTFYPESRAMFSAETIPNHVAMMTGVVPARNGIPTNNFIDFLAEPEPEERDLSLPEELTANTLFTWLKQECVSSGTAPELRVGAVLSKKYLYEIFEGDAANAERANRNPRVNNLQPDEYWDPTSSPAYLPSPDEHTVDAATMQEVLARLPGVDFMFVNLGDVDRAAHAFDQIGRTAVLPATDTQVGLLVQQLQDAGRWANTVMIVVSDHGMDFSLNNPLGAVSTQPTLDALGACFAPMTAVQNGGTNSLVINDRSVPLADQQTALRATRACLLGEQDCASLCAGTTRPANADGVVAAWYTRDDAQDPAGNMPASIRSRHPNLGDLVLVAADGVKFSEPNLSGNAIPGNHGHLETIHNTMLVTGGVPWLKSGNVVAPSIADPGPLERLPEQSENIDVAATVAWLFGLQLSAGDFPDGQGFDGRVLGEAFSQFDGNPDPAPPSNCGFLPEAAPGQ